jgi:hypothetical protein
MDNSADGESSNQKVSNPRNSGGKKSNLDLSQQRTSSKGGDLG